MFVQIEVCSKDNCSNSFRCSSMNGQNENKSQHIWSITDTSIDRENANLVFVILFHFEKLARTFPANEVLRTGGLKLQLCQNIFRRILDQRNLKIESRLDGLTFGRLFISLNSVNLEVKRFNFARIVELDFEGWRRDGVSDARQVFEVLDRPFEFGSSDLLDVTDRFLDFLRPDLDNWRHPEIANKTSFK